MVYNDRMAHLLVERTFEVGVPLAAAWSILGDVESWPRWAPHIRSARLADGELGPDTAGEFHFRPAGSATFTVTEWKPKTSWTWRGRAFGLPIDYTHHYRTLTAGLACVRCHVLGQSMRATDSR